VQLGDASNNGQAQTRLFRHFSVGHESIEEAIAEVGWYPGPTISNPKNDQLAF
jgi:hypothetical protein